MESRQTSTLNRTYWLGKLFSLSGIVPLGLYVIFHLYANMKSWFGEDTFNQHLSDSRRLPLIVPITILVIWIPIAFHGLYGLLQIKKSRPNLGSYRFFNNLKYVLQRLSAIGLLLFIPAHIYKTRIEPALYGSQLDFSHMVEGLHEPLTLTVYILGVLGAAFHLANGLWQFCIGWGVVTTQAAMDRIQRLSYVFFIILLIMGYGAIWGFYRAAP